jgi:hypothetical protein
LNIIAQQSGIFLNPRRSRKILLQQLAEPPSGMLILLAYCEAITQAFLQPGQAQRKFCKNVAIPAVTDIDLSGQSFTNLFTKLINMLLNLS